MSSQSSLDLQLQTEDIKLAPWPSWTDQQMRAEANQDRPLYIAHLLCVLIQVNEEIDERGWVMQSGVGLCIDI